MNTENRDQATSQFVLYLRDVAKEKGISQNMVASIVEDAITKVYYRINAEERLFNIKIDLDKNEINSYERYLVVSNDKEDEYDDLIEILEKDVPEGGHIVDGYYCEPYDFTEIFTKNESNQVLNFLRQRLKELDNEKIFKEWEPKVGTVILAEVESYDKRSGNYKINLKNDNFGFLQAQQLSGTEKLNPLSSYHFYVLEVKQQSKGWPVLLSRAHPGFVDYWLKLEIPELSDGTFEIIKTARIAGFRTKVAIVSNDKTLDPISICLGKGGNRIKSVSQKINGERIDLVRYDEDPAKFIVRAIGVEFVDGIDYDNSDPEKITATVFVKDENLANVIGKGGNNIRLVAKLSNTNIDAISVSEAKKNNYTYTRINPDDYIVKLAPLPSKVRNHADLMADFDTYDDDITDLFEDNTTETASPVVTKQVEQTIEEEFEPVVEIDTIQTPSDDVDDFDDSDEDFELTNEMFKDLDL